MIRRCRSFRCGLAVAKKVVNASADSSTRSAYYSRVIPWWTLSADYLISNDKGFALAHNKTIEGIRVVTPRILWQETLADSALT
jgi:hypothetical protein